MEPFISKYSISKEKSYVEQNLYKYDYVKDILVYKKSNDPVIEGVIPLYLSGSYITEAGKDSTTDESTDR
ncbi:hypothetical protein BX659_11019 [Orenia metallireducens]|uniref:Uncharacterized protein n=1 Tax=Orenia metallireducens TaxID=1413210 RepID=A0A285I0Z5_9FIRM|nr:hypothetical protein [Orenia metallireducens]PRX29275.1 hypothetical protein BX659_11019 [Orenia metallireducens]SNY40611.1 hypothetical protein SAMN06265827_12719 [Orenia metallireducens]